MYRKIELDAPNIGAPEKKWLNKIVDAGFVSTFGPFVPEFEKKFGKFLGVDEAVSTQSGTSALHMALNELGIKKDDEVIVPALTFIASINPITYVGARPVFVDVDINTWTIDVKRIEEKITKRTKAIMPVHLYGNPCDMKAILDIAKRKGLRVIEDATESLGALYNERHTGTIGDFGCFSFNGNKVITTGGGGMIIGKDRKKLEHIRFLINQGRDKANGYYHSEIGFNYRMTNLEAALGLAQMEKLEYLLEKKKRINSIYRKQLKNTRGVSFQEEVKGGKSSWWFTAITLNGSLNASTVQKELEAQEVPSRRLFMPVTEFPPYSSVKKSEYPAAYHLYEKGLCLPSSTINSDKNINLTAKAIKKAVNR